MSEDESSGKYAPQTGSHQSGHGDSNGAAVIRLTVGPLPVYEFASLVARHADMYRADAAKLCAEGPGILFEDLELEAAKKLALALRDKGEQCFVAPTRSLIRVPRPRHITSARLMRSSFHALDSAGNAEKAPWDKAVALPIADVIVHTSETKTKPQSIWTRRAPYVGFTGMPGVAVGMALSRSSKRQTVSRSDTETYLDLIFLDPMRHYRIEAGQFSYKILGDQLESSSAANVRTLARWFLHAAGHLRTNIQADELMETGHVGMPCLVKQQFREMVRWLVNLAHFDEEPSLHS